MGDIRNEDLKKQRNLCILWWDLMTDGQSWGRMNEQREFDLMVGNQWGTQKGLLIQIPSSISVSFRIQMLLSTELRESTTGWRSNDLFPAKWMRENECDLPASSICLFFFSIANLTVWSSISWVLLQMTGACQRHMVPNCNNFQWLKMELSEQWNK